MTTSPQIQPRPQKGSRLSRIVFWGVCTIVGLPASFLLCWNMSRSAADHPNNLVDSQLVRPPSSFGQPAQTTIAPSGRNAYSSRGLGGTSRGQSSYGNRYQYQGPPLSQTGGYFDQQVTRTVTETEMREETQNVRVPYTDREGRTRYREEQRTRLVPKTINRQVTSVVRQPLPHASEVSRLASEITRSEAEPDSEQQTEAVRRLTELLGEQFDVMHAEQQARIDRLEKQLSELKEMHSKRHRARTEIIKRRIGTLTFQPDPLAWQIDSLNQPVTDQLVPPTGSSLFNGNAVNSPRTRPNTRAGSFGTSERFSTNDLRSNSNQSRRARASRPAAAPSFNPPVSTNRSDSTGDLPGFFPPPVDPPAATDARVQDRLPSLQQRAPQQNDTLRANSQSSGNLQNPTSNVQNPSSNLQGFQSPKPVRSPESNQPFLAPNDRLDAGVANGLSEFDLSADDVPKELDVPSIEPLKDAIDKEE